MPSYTARKAERDKLHGWADGMSALRFGKAMASLHKQIRIEGAVMRRYEFVHSRTSPK